MNRRRRTPAVALLGLLAPLALPALAACGIQKSDVVEAGGAATVVVAPVPETRMLLYFLGPDGRTMPVARDLGSGAAFGPDGTGDARTPYDGFGPGYETGIAELRGSGIFSQKVLAALLAGPHRAETAAGLTTALPRTREIPRVVEEKSGGTEGRRLFRLRLPFPVTGLKAAAVRQLVCTTAYAEDPSGRAEISVTGPDGTLPTARCDDPPAPD